MAVSVSTLVLRRGDLLPCRCSGHNRRRRLRLFLVVIGIRRFSIHLCRCTTDILSQTLHIAIPARSRGGFLRSRSSCRIDDVILGVVIASAVARRRRFGHGFIDRREVEYELACRRHCCGRCVHRGRRRSALLGDVATLCTARSP